MKLTLLKCTNLIGKVYVHTLCTHCDTILSMNKADTTTINVRIDRKTKEEAQETLENIGLDMSSAIKVFLRTVNITKSIPFELRTENGFTIAQERELLKDAKDALENSPGYNSAEDLHAAIMCDE